MNADPKPAKRIKASRSEWEMIRRAKLDVCRACRYDFRIELHHLVPRSQAGDDVADNLVPLCFLCHGLIENRNATTEVALGLKLTRPERNYVIRKKGLYYLIDRYRTCYPEDEDYQELLREVAA